MNNLNCGCVHEKSYPAARQNLLGWAEHYRINGRRSGLKIIQREMVSVRANRPRTPR